MAEFKNMKQIPKDERPYEKCVRLGAQSLTDAELLAVLLRTGTVGSPSVHMAEEILSLSKDRKGLLGLHTLSLAQLKSVKGIGTTARKGLQFTQPGTIADYYMERLRHKEQEELICMMLDTKNHLLGEEMIFKGTVNGSFVSPREIFLTAMSYHAVGILLVHNHPSGDPTPSQADLDVTQRIAEAGELLGIPLLDHIIIGDCKYLSFRQQGIF